MSAAVVIAASNLMPGLCSRLAEEGELLTFADTEPIQALQAILEILIIKDRYPVWPHGHVLKRSVGPLRIGGPVLSEVQLDRDRSLCASHYQGPLGYSYLLPFDCSPQTLPVRKNIRGGCGVRRLLGV